MKRFSSMFKYSVAVMPLALMPLCGIQDTVGSLFDSLSYGGFIKDEYCS
jgi:hypothetical protein